MDSLKIPKGGNSNAAGGAGGKPTGSVPITVRFNAGDECIDDIFQSFHNSNNSGGGVGGAGVVAGGNGSVGGGGGGVGSGGGGGGPNAGGGDSLSSSPSQHHQLQAQQNVDDVNTRNNFLQGNFFNRKRSGSIEGVSPTSTGPNLIAALAGSDTPTVGTWKLIKGKVSQTLEDIKSSKNTTQVLSASVPKVESSRQYFPQQTNEPDSDPENPTTHSSISDDLPFDLERKSPHLKGGDSDSSADGELLPEGEIERSRLRRGLANLKSKVKSKTHHHTHQSHSPSQQQPGLTTAALSSATISTAFGTAAIKPMKKEPTGPSSAASSSSLRDALMRRRRPSPTEQAAAMSRVEPAESQPTVAEKKSNAKTKKRGIISGKKEVEIESGVEMMEDTLPTTPQTSAANAEEPRSSSRNRQDLRLQFDKSSSNKASPPQIPSGLPADGDTIKRQNELETLRHAAEILERENDRERERHLQPKKRFTADMPISRLAVLIVVLLLPVHGFIRGVLACLMSFAIVDSLSVLARSIIYKFFEHHPEGTDFEIPDYTKMPICEVPAVEEHKTIKSYAGWMNEIFSYDPLTYHISQTNSVYLRLDGTYLRVSTTTARIPKRIMWNEQPIDIKHIHFTSHRVFNLLGCSVELLPLGLARKRYFNRKYPIQLIIKNGAEEDTQQEPSEIQSTQLSARGSKSDLTSMDSRMSQVSTDIYEQYGESKEKSSSNVQDIDFAATVMNADLQQLQDNTLNKDGLIPCGDEVRLILFSRGDREKEDWYRRFVAASEGDVHDQMLRLPNLKFVDDAELQRVAAKAAQMHMESREGVANANEDHAETESHVLPADMAPPLVVEGKPEKGETFKDIPDDMEVVPSPTDAFEGLLMSSCAARNPPDYIRFMAIYQSACKDAKIPVHSKPNSTLEKMQKSRRSKRHAKDLWKGIDQSLFLGPSGSVVWANVLIGRVLYSCLHDNMVKDKIKELLQKKISAIKLPSFIEDVVITKINLGDTPPLIHRVSQPMLDERGTWVDADVTYEGLLQLTVTTKLNLMRIKQQKRPQDPFNITVPNPVNTGPNVPSTTNFTVVPPIVIADAEGAGRNSSNLRSFTDEAGNTDEGSSNVIFDSDAESTGDSDTDPESLNAPTATGSTMNTGASTTAAGQGSSQGDAGAGAGAATDYHFIPTAPGNARRIFRIVDRIAASNFFQYATDLPVVQRAIENMNTNITLRVDLRGLVGRGVINIPPPPSDRIWLSFRGPPRLWLSAKPALGEKSVDYSIVTGIIESKLCEVVNKFLVFPNMVDVTIPFLGQPTYEYLRGEKTRKKSSE
ncbi:uncharacterized protein Tex2_1 isoform X1 [Zeugodacus cucurbitae]|uniref:uncharacterized protein Tex2_1 isoform X1 n=1 Tax=Zeugodacus cucurbitae TaxID=28588 RepID=UPI0023D93560|nr:uncharacterized protein Tex2_1 isoform X1 [Zeugodacus cucurbitae]XP_011180597.2 uncharacterized protein Tex2_1 isoform X1 [Zeugodacus cucurbitae]XP_011180598.2 uncharacterized protein Tex2_1 isoform X1 [Zeugodacus cucurbitae]XP_054085998.1 uncharacterized protein Tex2_1 isoform X1 [Zeugodacus cucurbitae]